jgi:protein-S-isoprenylcysteine O-methyltransferase Ste14
MLPAAIMTTHISKQIAFFILLSWINFYIHFSLKYLNRPVRFSPFLAFRPPPSAERRIPESIDTKAPILYIGPMQTWPLRLGKFLFRFRSFTPLPLILLTFLFFKPLSPAPFWTFFGLAVAFLGEGLRMASVGFAHSGTSGRESFLKADSLNTRGLYSLARNPLYWGNMLIFSGLLILFANPWALALFVVFLFLQYHFIVLAEESYLREQHGRPYEEYCAGVRRWLPRFNRWEPPTGPCNWKKVLFKENDSCFNLLLGALLILAWKEKYFCGRLLRPLPFALAAAGLVLIYAAIKVLKKRGRAKIAA